jgi:hypothetical protein
MKMLALPASGGSAAAATHHLDGGALTTPMASDRHDAPNVEVAPPLGSREGRVGPSTSEGLKDARVTGPCVLCTRPQLICS